MKWDGNLDHETDKEENEPAAAIPPQGIGNLITALMMSFLREVQTGAEANFSRCKHEGAEGRIAWSIGKECFMG